MSKSFLDKLIERRDAVKAEMDAVLEAVASEDRTDLTADETTKVDTLVEESRTLDSKIEKMKAQADADAKANEIRSAVADVAMPKIGGAVVTREERTYSPNSEASFVKDAFNAQFANDYAANERLARHMREESIERRDVGTAQFEGLVIPQYLVDLAAPYARAGRPFADFATNKMTLPPSGMTLNISRMTTGSSTAVQVTQNDAVSETDVDDTLLTVNVRTIAGQQDISRQAIERGTGIDTFVVADLIKSWHTTLDSQILNGAGTAGTIKGLRASGGNAITFTSTAPTVALLYPEARRCDPADPDKRIRFTNTLGSSPTSSRILACSSRQHKPSTCCTSSKRPNKRSRRWRSTNLRKLRIPDARTSNHHRCKHRNNIRNNNKPG